MIQEMPPLTVLAEQNRTILYHLFSKILIIQKNQVLSHSYWSIKSRYALKFLLPKLYHLQQFFLFVPL